VFPKPENFIRWKNILVKKGRIVSENGWNNTIFVVIYATESVKYKLFKLLGFQCVIRLRNVIIQIDVGTYNVTLAYIYERVLVYHNNSIN